MAALLALGSLALAAFITTAAGYAAWNWIAGSFFDVTHIGMWEMFFLAFTVRVVDGVLKSVVGGDK